MRDLIKKILFTLPLPIRTLVVHIRDAWWQSRMQAWEAKKYQHLPILFTPTPHDGKKNVLIYCISGLTFAGTEKNLQVIANSLADAYNVFYMYGDKTAEDVRKETMNSNITFIPFSYTKNEIPVPHKLTGMKPHIKGVLTEKNIDLIITASPGYSHYPWNIITEIPIVLVDIFGAPTLQNNVAATVFVSETVRKHAEIWTGKRTTHHTLYSPLAKLPPNNVRDLGTSLRTKLGISKSDFVFGRIGRADNAIFDPIGIRAWQKIAGKFPSSHYLIMSPPPVLIDMVEKEKIPRVHFLTPSSKEEDVWAFHGALDCFAHFRHDGETSGVAIAESLIIGNPTITHRSRIWNAHLEYLNDSCARIAEIDDIGSYSRHMENFIQLRTTSKQEWDKLKQSAQKIGTSNFSPITYGKKINSIIKSL